MGKIAALFWAAATATSVHGMTFLDPDNFAEKTQGKIVFLMFTSPTCVHCESVRSDWKQLAADYEGSQTFLVASVDCKKQAQFCLDTFEVDGVPTFLYGNPAEGGYLLEEYEDERDYESFKEFAFHMFMGPICNEETMENCSEEQKETILAFRALDEPDHVPETPPGRRYRVSPYERNSAKHRAGDIGVGTAGAFVVHNEL